MDITENDSKKKLSNFELFLKPFFLANKAQRLVVILIIPIFAGLFLISLGNNIYKYIGIAVIIISIICILMTDAYYSAVAVNYKTQLFIRVWNKLLPFRLNSGNSALHKADRLIFLVNLIFNFIIVIFVLAMLYYFYTNLR
ncbi:MAG: hypothetical protein Q7K55_07735 [Candidatus Levybacteria bacterium]|nr:hypothetical protein [Candidatus Levybacteria bacterium]